MQQGLLDVLIALLQSLVVLLLASGVYVALVVRKSDPSPGSADAEPAVPPRRPTAVG
jgi:flagellar basal body-associated protein FliL